MAIKNSGTLYMTDIVNEFGGGAPHYLSEYYRGGSYVTPSATGVPTSGTIWFSHFYGEAKSTAGSRSFTSPGTYSFTIPVFSTIKFDVRGAGGGGGGSTYDIGAAGSAGNAGGNSAVSGVGVSATGGKGGAGSFYNTPGPGANGVGSGGDVNTTINNGGTGGTYALTKGGDGGDGGRAYRTFSPGEDSGVYAGRTVTVTVGTGGGGGSGQVAGTSGGHGSVYIDWT